MIGIVTKIVFGLMLLTTAAYGRPKHDCILGNTEPAPKPPTPECKNGVWTNWYDTDDPLNGWTFQDNCDIEKFSVIRDLHPEICANPSAVDVQIVNGPPHPLAWNIDISVSEVKCCHGSNMISSTACHVCHDYEVRYCCPATVGKCEVGTEYSSVNWGPWWNVDTPNTNGDDLEVVSNMLGGKIPVCANRIAIEARVALTNLPYASGGDILTFVSAANGLKCPLGVTECKDYKVRFCCAKKRTTVGVSQHMFQHERP